jgi:hypothetical protein
MDSSVSLTAAYIGHKMTDIWNNLKSKRDHVAILQSDLERALTLEPNRALGG